MFDIKVFFWNARGIANAGTQRYFKNLICTHRADLVFLVEPWCTLHSLKDLWSALSLKFISANSRGVLHPNLWIFYATHLNPSVISISDQQVTLSLSLNGFNCSFSIVYASTSYVRRRNLWKSLLDLNISTPWYCLGDFNAVVSTHEKQGGLAPLPTSCTKFRTFSNAAALVHLPNCGSFFTWNNGRLGNQRIHILS